MDPNVLLAGLGGIGGLLTAFGVNDLRDIGEAANTAAGDVASDVLGMSTFKPYTMTTATGGTFGATAGEDGMGTTMTLSPQEQALQAQMFGGARLLL